MLQVTQNIDTGELALANVPPPALLPGGVRVRTAASLISAGTEKMLIDLAQKSLLGKARSRPDLVRQVWDKVMKEGLRNTYQNVRSKMEKPMPLGYSAAGIIEAVGEQVRGLRVGDRVAIAGAGYASHAEINYVPRNLVTLIPEGVSFDDAAYTTVASIALQGVRLTRPELGDNVGVIGLGLIGLITVQLLRASGCRVLGVDLDPAKIELGMRLGMDDGIAVGEGDVSHVVDRFTRGHGVDATLITAASSQNGPIELAGEITRRKGRVVAVGAIGMDVPRDVYYRKELEISVSMSYGPGRYDPSYEEGGVDYPYEYVRWTEQRNMEAVLGLLARGDLDVANLTTHRFPFDGALDAYRLMHEGKEGYVGIILQYDVERPQEAVVPVVPEAHDETAEGLGVAFVGAGNYAAIHLLPHLKTNPAVSLRGLMTGTGINAQQKAAKFGFEYCTTEFGPLIENERVDAVFIATRHSTHAQFVVKALLESRHVFVEKPLVVSEDQLEEVIAAYEKANLVRRVALMVGLNRRFAPMVSTLKAAFGDRDPKQLVYRVNSGPISTTSWLHEEAEGGGMLVGEMCHFIDLMQYVTGERPATVYARSLRLNRDDLADRDNLSVVIGFDGGSVGMLAYNTVGDKSASKERLEVYGGGVVAVLDDFRVLEITSSGRRSRKKSANQDKGQKRQIEATVEAFRQGASPIPFAELVTGMRTVFAARRSMLTGEAVSVHTAQTVTPIP